MIEPGIGKMGGDYRGMRIMGIMGGMGSDNSMTRDSLRLGCKRQRIPGKRNLGPPGTEDDLDNIDPDGNSGLVQQVQPRLGAADECLLLVGTDGIRRAPEHPRGACLDLDENERLLLPADQVDLAAVLGPVVAVEDLESLPAQVPGGKALAQPTEPQVRRLRRRGRGAAAPPGEKSCDESGKVHGF